jgi:hypothetical protein
MRPSGAGVWPVSAAVPRSRIVPHFETLTETLTPERRWKPRMRPDANLAESRAQRQGRIPVDTARGTLNLRVVGSIPTRLTKPLTALMFGVVRDQREILDNPQIRDDAFRDG